MYYYGNSYGYGNAGNCCGAQMNTSGCGSNSNFAIILVLFILLIIILGARAWN